MRKLWILLMIVSLVVFAQGQSKLNKKSSISAKYQQQAVQQLVEKYGEANRERIEIGTKQAAAFWTKKDGKSKEYVQFCVDNFIADPNELSQTAKKLSRYQEVLIGFYNRMGLMLQWDIHVDTGELTKIDQMYGSYDPSAHLADDLFETKIAFMVLLNFPYYSLDQKMALGEKWTREQWAFARLGDVFDARVPAKEQQTFSKLLTEVDSYIADYNIYMGRLVTDEKKTIFPEDLALITHWGLRDELKAQYAQGQEGLARQEMIYQVMQRIINQDIPQPVINKKDYLWNPVTNQLFDQAGNVVEFKAEPCTRYEHVFKLYKALRDIDPYYPNHNTAIKRAFDLDMEIPVAEIESVFEEFLSSPMGKEAGALIAKRLGRPIQPFDIWYDGFKPRSGIKQEDLDQKVAARYSNVADFEKDIPNILRQLGFKDELATHLGGKISVDPARGAGHAAGAEMRAPGFNAHLRTRVPKNGMNYKGFNIAMHELGHNVEQVMTLHDVDQYMLHGVPNTAFTEAWAFVFQARDLDVLGMQESNPDFKHLKALDSFWSSREIMGVSLVDIKLWQWMYENKPKSEQEIRDAAVRIAKEVWNKYFADVFGVRDSPILAIYSHMIAYPLYLSAYPVGHLIEFQLEKQIEGKNIGDEMYRIYTYGRIVPQLWMKNAVGSPLSSRPMLEATQEALQHIK